MIDRLAQPEALALLALVPLVAWGLSHRRRRAAVSLPAPPGGSIPRSLRVRLARLLPAMRVLTVLALVIALARPQEVSGESRTRTEGVAIQLVVDRSGSMDEPIPAGREEARKMDVVKSVLERFILGGDEGDPSGVTLEPREGDMLGLIAFARYADTVCPLVRDRQAVASLVGNLDTVKVRSEDGTAVGDALALAAARLRRAEEELAARRDPAAPAAPTDAGPDPGAAGDFTIKSKVIVLLTDGVNNAGSEDPLEVARLAHEWGIKIYVIGVGAGPRMVTMRTGWGDQRIPMGPSLDEGALRAIAEATDGRYFPATDAASLLEISAEIGRLERSEIHVLEFDHVRELFIPFAGVAAALIALESLLGATWLRRSP